MPSAKKEPKVEPSTDIHTNMCHHAVVHCSPPNKISFSFQMTGCFPWWISPSLLAFSLTQIHPLPSPHLPTQPHTPRLTLSVSVYTPGSHASLLGSLAPREPGSLEELVTSCCVYSSASVCASCKTQIISRATVVPPVYNWDNLPQDQLGLGPG